MTFSAIEHQTLPSQITQQRMNSLGMADVVFLDQIRVARKRLAQIGGLLLDRFAPHFQTYFAKHATHTFATNGVEFGVVSLQLRREP